MSIPTDPALPAGISVVIPVYRSAPSLRPLCTRLLPVLARIGQPHEVIFVNDGSPDESWDIISALVAEHRGVRGIRLLRNYGQHNALLAGIRAARYATLITMDDDGQHPPEEIPKLLTALAAGHDVVYGPPEKQQHGLWRDLASYVTKFVLRKTIDARTARMISAFRAVRTEVRAGFARYESPFVNIDVLLTWGASRFTAVPVRHEARAFGESNYTVSKLLRHTLNMLTGFSVAPLQLASLIGFVFTAFGLGVLAYVLINYLIHGSSVAGFPFLASVIAIFAGAQLFALGIIGEYLARMYHRTMDKPAYTIGQNCSHPDDRA